MMLLALLGCVEQGLSAVEFDAIAVVQGDFDNVTEPLTALLVQTQPYDGYIVQATYEPEEDRTTRDNTGLPGVEGLLTGEVDGSLQLDLYGAVFVNSGTRGLGATVYNNALEADDSILLDTEAVQNVCDYVERGRTLVVSDWAYDLVERCWPDSIEFVGDDLVPDAAQTGMPSPAVLAEVRDEALAEALGSSVSVRYDYSAWSVIESVGAGAEVMLAGNVEYQPSAEELPTTLATVPMMVRLRPGNGQVIYTTFHIAAQSASLAQGLLLHGVEGLEEGAGSDSTSVVSGEEDSGA